MKKLLLFPFLQKEPANVTNRIGRMDTNEAFKCRVLWGEGVFRFGVKYGIEPKPAGISKFVRESDLVLLMLMEVPELGINVRIGT